MWYKKGYRKITLRAPKYKNTMREYPCSLKNSA